MADLLQRMATSKPRRILQAAPAHDGAISWVYAPAEGQTKQVIEGRNHGCWPPMIVESLSCLRKCSATTQQSNMSHVREAMLLKHA